MLFVQNGLSACPLSFLKKQVLAIIQAMTGTHQLMVKILYGCGLRSIECIRLRVKDIHLSINQIIVCDGKGKKERVTMLLENINKIYIRPSKNFKFFGQFLDYKYRS